MNKEEEKRLDNSQYMQILHNKCNSLFLEKLHDYGAAWRILRPSSVTDQIYIKVARIRSLQLTGENHVGESIESEFVGIVNYGIIGLIQLKHGFSEKVDISVDSADQLYDFAAAQCVETMEKKNHDYGEAWRNMRVETITDLILSKVFRTKQIEDNKGETVVSEGIAANYIDMVNYAIFALCLLQGNKIDAAGTLQGDMVMVNENGEPFIKRGDDIIPVLSKDLRSEFVQNLPVYYTKDVDGESGTAQSEFVENKIAHYDPNANGPIPYEILQPAGDKIHVAERDKPEITPGAGTEQ